ncbi:UDP-N-acetylmuramoyl-L-alanine--D-glutamate ligase [Nitriliruptoraceae bacterium ZYF776]|nr:UDP-N-acetylmuramoyl-L-alanine--D-glutamate ligase [Profundirhabdus halotolerans]
MVVPAARRRAAHRPRLRHRATPARCRQQLQPGLLVDQRAHRVVRGLSEVPLRPAHPGPVHRPCDAHRHPRHRRPRGPDAARRLARAARPGREAVRVRRDHRGGTAGLRPPRRRPRVVGHPRGPHLRPRGHRGGRSAGGVDRRRRRVRAARAAADLVRRGRGRGPAVSGTGRVLLAGLGRETRDWLETAADDAEVVVVDERPVPDDDPARAHPRLSVHAPVDLDAPLPDDLGEVDRVVRSPGISPYRTAIAQLRDRGTPVETPTGAWLAADDRPNLIAITGTKGKSTTAAMTAHVLRAAGRDVALCGNIGRSPLTGVDRADQDVVVELSSYQLADLDAWLPIGGLTTLLQDHVPWHGSVARYHADKLRLLERSRRRLVTRAAAQLPAVADLVDAVADVAAQRDRLAAAVEAAGLVGDHLVDDAALAVGLADALLADAGVPVAPGVLLDALHDFAPLPHRLTPVAEVGGVRFVDDSISTVPEAALAALAAYRPLGPVTLLLGGDDRGQPLETLAAAVADPDVRVVLLSALGDRLARLLEAAGTRFVRAQDLRDAVHLATAVTPAGGSVVLSPAAPSFGTHRDFVDRGEDFTRLVHGLRED